MSDGVIGIGVVGYGYWGPNLVRKYFVTRWLRALTFPSPIVNFNIPFAGWPNGPNGEWTRKVVGTI